MNEKRPLRDSSDLFQTDAWFENLIRHGFQDAPICIPLKMQTPAGDVCLRLMHSQEGEMLQALSNYYSCLFAPQGPLAAMHAQGWSDMAMEIQASAGSAVVRLQPLDASSGWLASFESAVRSAGYWTDRFFCFGNWYQPVPVGGFSAYWPERPSVLRHSVERGRRRLDRGGTWSLRIVTGEADDLDAAIAAYEHVYAHSWKQPEPCPGFMPNLIKTAAREGWLRLGVLWFNGQPLASQLWLVCGGKANIYKLAYVKGFEKFSAGSVLTAALMEHVMDIDKVEEVDYLSGDDAYKADWMAMRRERVGLLACNMRHWRGWLAAGRQMFGRWRRSIRSSSAQSLPGNST